MSHLDFELRDIPSIANTQYITLSGAIDAATAIEFQGYLEKLVTKGTTNFIFDMNGVTFINSTGLGLLVNLADSADNKKGSFILVNTHSKIRIVFQTLGLDNYFEMFNTLSDALRHLTQNLSPEQQEQIVNNVKQILETEPEKTHATVADKTLPAPVIAVPIKTKTQPIEKPKVAEPAPRQPVEAPKPRVIPPPQPMYAPPPTQVPSKPKDKITRIMGVPQKKIAAFIIVPPSLQHFGPIYTHVQGACVSVNVIATRVDYNDPNFMEKAKQLISKVNFIIADFSAADNLTLQQAHYARFVHKPPKPLLGIIQGSPANLPPQWQKTSFISYQLSNTGLQRLKAILEQTISRAMSKL